MNEPGSTTSLRESLVDLLLEERFADARRGADTCAAPRPSNRALQHGEPRLKRLLAAALVLAGAAVVVGTTLYDRNGRYAGRQAPQDPSSGAASKSAAAYFPLRLGDRWQYVETVGGDERRLDVEVTVVVEKDGQRVAQLAEVRDDGVVGFSFWSCDDAGVWRHTNGQTSGDPFFKPYPKTSSLELPAPVGARVEWRFERFADGSGPGRDVGGAAARGVIRAVAAPSGRRYEAELQGVDNLLELRGRSYRTVHVLLQSDGGARTEHRHYSRGVGVVLETIEEAGRDPIRRELVRFVPAPPRPDRAALLATATSAAAAAAAKWLPSHEHLPAAWVLASEFAIVREDDGPVVYRVHGDRAVRFDETALDDYVALAADERFAERWSARLFPQRGAEALAELRWQLAAALADERFELGDRGVRVSAAGAVATQRVTLIGADGAREVGVEAAVRDGVPIAIEMR